MVAEIWASVMSLFVDHLVALSNVFGTLGLGSGLVLWSGLVLVLLGTLSRYFCAHSITPS